MPVCECVLGARRPVCSGHTRTLGLPPQWCTSLHPCPSFPHLPFSSGFLLSSSFQSFFFFFFYFDFTFEVLGPVSPSPVFLPPKPLRRVRRAGRQGHHHQVFCTQEVSDPHLCRGGPGRPWDQGGGRRETGRTGRGRLCSWGLARLPRPEEGEGALETDPLPGGRQPWLHITVTWGSYRTSPVLASPISPHPTPHPPPCTTSWKYRVGGRDGQDSQPPHY